MGAVRGNTAIIHAVPNHMRKKGARNLPERELLAVWVLPTQLVAITATMIRPMVNFRLVERELAELNVTCLTLIGGLLIPCAVCVPKSPSLTQASLNVDLEELFFSCSFSLSSCSVSFVSTNSSSELESSLCSRTSVISTQCLGWPIKKEDANEGRQKIAPFPGYLALKSWRWAEPGIFSHVSMMLIRKGTKVSEQNGNMFNQLLYIGLVLIARI